jgi:hypothetical protein
VIPGTQQLWLSLVCGGLLLHTRGGSRRSSHPEVEPALPQTRGSTTHQVSNINPGGDGARPHVEEAVRSRHGSWNLMEVRRQMVVMSPVYACVAEQTLR